MTEGEVCHVDIQLKTFQYKVELQNVQKVLRKIPHHVTIKLMAWVKDVEHFGLPEVRKIPGYHDEPLKGHRKGQRSIRQSKAYRAIYTTEVDGNIQIVSVEEVHKHEY